MTLLQPLMCEYCSHPKCWTYLGAVWRGKSADIECKCVLHNCLISSNFVEMKRFFFPDFHNGVIFIAQKMLVIVGWIVLDIKGGMKFQIY
jgi:hypothetical protein